MAIYLVTGGAGFIGSHIVDELVQRGERVKVLDDFSTGRRENLLGARGQIELFEGDIRNRQVVQLAMQGVDYVLHQAALPSVPRSVADPLTTNEVNVTGTLNVLVAAREARVRRVVYASSSSVYGNNPALPKHETMPIGPLSPYATSKLAGENYCRAFHHVYGLPTVALRYFNVFGPRQDPTSQYAGVMPRFIVALLRDESPTIYGDGTQSRDFTYVANVVQANLLACYSQEAIGQVMNVACGERHTLLDLHSELKALIGKNIRPVFGPARVGDVNHSLAAIDLASRLLGYRPSVGWHEGLRRTVMWYKDQTGSIR
ncbi:MAG: SDR family oxidoreductase [Chloroflexi bacterium]|nr:SDR family oxidoreductase [Chloroflexota bacterium]